MNNQRMIALAEATADHIAAKRKEHQQAMKNQCPSCGQDMREEPREDCPQCGQSSPAPALLAQRDALQAQVADLTAQLHSIRPMYADAKRIADACVCLVASLSEQYNTVGLTGFAVIRDYHAAVAALHHNYEPDTTLAQKGPL